MNISDSAQKLYVHQLLFEFSSDPKPDIANNHSGRYDLAIQEDNFNVKVKITNLSDRVFPESHLEQIMIKSDGITKFWSKLRGEKYSIKALHQNKSDFVKCRIDRPITGDVEIGVSLNPKNSGARFDCLYRRGGEDIVSLHPGGFVKTDDPDGCGFLAMPLTIISDAEIEKIKEEEIEKSTVKTMRCLQFGVSCFILILSAINVWHSFWG